jgi:hypothetical protein
MRERKAKGDLCVKLDLIDWLHVDNKERVNWIGRIICSIFCLSVSSKEINKGDVWIKLV